MALPLPGSLSPSKVSTFTDCAFAFRLANIDKVPQEPSSAAVRGTLVHRALQLLFGEEQPGARTLDVALAKLERAIEELATDPEYVALGLGAEEAAGFRTEADGLVRRYFDLEDPNDIRVIGVELLLEARIGPLVLRGIIDRLELDDDGGLMITDYKTGRAPGAAFELQRLAGVRFYALLCELALGRRPVRLQLLHLDDPIAISLVPSEQSMRGLQHRAEAIWAAIERGCADDDFQPNVGRHCDWCSYKAYCPAFGGDVAAIPPRPAPASAPVPVPVPVPVPGREPMTEARITGLHRTPARGLPLERLAEAVVRADWGVDGDRHARPASSRQVVLVAAEVLDGLGLAAGATREQLTISCLGDVDIGDAIVIGDVRLEITGPRVPCRIMDRVRPGLMEELRGRGGWCARVLAGGTIRPGDAVSVEREAVDDPPWLRDYLRALGEWEASSSTPPDDGWSGFGDRFAHLIAWDRRGAERIEARAAGASSQQWGPTDIDAFNAAAVDELGARTDLWVLHDDWSTAVVEAARRWPAAGEPWVRSLTAHYREHT